MFLFSKLNIFSNYYHDIYFSSIHRFFNLFRFVSGVGIVLFHLICYFWQSQLLVTVFSSAQFYTTFIMYVAGGEPLFNNGSFSPVPIHIVTYAGQLPSEFLEPSPDRQLVIGLDCEGVDLCRTGALCIMQVKIHFITLIPPKKKTSLVSPFFMRGWNSTLL